MPGKMPHPRYNQLCIECNDVLKDLRLEDKDLWYEDKDFKSKDKDL